MRTDPPDPANLAKVIAKFDNFDAVTERAAISVMKLAGWIATVAVVLYGLWKSL